MQGLGFFKVEIDEIFVFWSSLSLSRDLFVVVSLQYLLREVSALLEIHELCKCKNGFCSL